MTAREFVIWWLGRFDDVNTVRTFYSFSKSTYGLGKQKDLEEDARQGLCAYTKLNKDSRRVLVREHWRLAKIRQDFAQITELYPWVDKGPRS